MRRARKGTVTHVHVLEPAGMEYAAEDALEAEGVIDLWAPIVYNQRGAVFAPLTGVLRLTIPLTNVTKIQVWAADESRARNL